MNDAGALSVESRLLILAPLGRDAQLVRSMLAADQIDCQTCADLDAALQALEVGAAALLVAEEALAEDAGRLQALVARQPPWSDLPILLLTRTGANS